MSHKQAPYPFDGMPDEDYFGEFRELSSTIAPFEKANKINNNTPTNTLGEKSTDIFDGFSVFPMD